MSYQQDHPPPPPQAPPVIRNRDLLALKAFITAKDENPYEDVHATTVLLDLTHSNLLQQHLEIRFDLQDTLATLRQRIHQKTGTPSSMQQLQIKSHGMITWDLPPNSPYEHHLLGFFGLHHGTQVHCIDLDPHSASRHGGYENVDLVTKYVMSDEEYTQRSNTLRHWKRQQQAVNPKFTLERHAQQHAAMAEAKRCQRLGLPLPKGFYYNAVLHQVVAVDEDDDEEHDNERGEHDQENAAAPATPPAPPDHIQVGQRCQVQPGGRRGVVRFVGIIPNMGRRKGKKVTTTPTTTAPDATATTTSTTSSNTTTNDASPSATDQYQYQYYFWIGVQFDEPVGKSNGIFQGKQYFDVPPHYGGFCQPHNVQVGDYPERDLFDEEDDGEEEHEHERRVGSNNGGDDDDDDDEL
jgi:tubulin-folding cofactor B